jgi:hypothetical protein
MSRKRPEPGMHRTGGLHATAPIQAVLVRSVPILSILLRDLNHFAENSRTNRGKYFWKNSEASAGITASLPPESRERGRRY